MNNVEKIRSVKKKQNKANKNYTRFKIAYSLLKELKSAESRAEKFLSTYDSVKRSRVYQNAPCKQDEKFWKKFAEYEKASDDAYKKYYDFTKADMKKSKVDFLDCRDKFYDADFVRDLYNQRRY